MSELGRRGAKGFEYEQMLEGVGEVILAANNVGDCEIGIVYARGKVIGGKAVRTKQSKVFDLVSQLGLFPVDAIGEAQDTILTAGDAIAEGELLACSGAAVGLFAGHFAHPGLKSHAPCADD